MRRRVHPRRRFSLFVRSYFDDAAAWISSRMIGVCNEPDFDFAHQSSTKGATLVVGCAARWRSKRQMKVRNSYVSHWWGGSTPLSQSLRDQSKCITTEGERGTPSSALNLCWLAKHLRCYLFWINAGRLVTRRVMATSFPTPEPSLSDSDSWEKAISDPDERKVFEALANPQWDFRTIPGLSKDTGFPVDRIARILRKYPNLVRKSVVPDLNNQNLYTLRSRRRKFKEFLATARAFMAGSIS
jgi:hypothetical protein